MSQITASQTIEKLRSIFAVHALPKKFVSDNGPTFTSHEFQEFMKRNGIVHVKAAPYHPSSNGLAERAVRSFKQGLKSTTGKSVQERLSKFFLKYHITPQSTTGIPPAEMLMKLESLKDKELKRFFTRRDELSLLDGCVLWGTREH